ncbi:MAG: DNA gyrase/topoisomerase IV subunit A [Verrucomicrobiales bacterium]|nr:DNA gyrase/topoisomerase IV subunit A [Verrucomicrobiales bacterium]
MKKKAVAKKKITKKTVAGIPKRKPPVGTGEGGGEPGNLQGMYSDYFLDYASYVILERAVPHIDDGLKPVQRRILHTMWEKEDGRYNKVANVVGHTMQYHPHGDASIGDAMVQLGQKDLLIDTQGNWGNILTGDRAAAPRYIEARLTKFALEVAFNKKTTVWAASYDGRNKEPVTLPMKFPLVLAQGVEGIAVGLACKILPHNFVELIDASIAALRRKPFELFPDFLTGGVMDVSEYNEGMRGGKIRVRARIEKTKKRGVLKISEIPFGTTTGSLMDSVVGANEKGKLKIAKVLDNTAENVEILLFLPPGTDPDVIIPALYAFTDCEVSISPNACVIVDDKPRFLSVHELLRLSANRTKSLLKQELEIRMAELEDRWHFSSLEKIFIENRIYRDIEECETWEAVMKAIWNGLKPFLKQLKREVSDDDVARLTEIKIKRISKYDSFKADELIRGIEGEMEEVAKNLKNLTRYAVGYFEQLKKKYGKGRERKTEIAEFQRVVASQAAVASETLYLNERDGFVGYGIKRDARAIGKCSRMAEVIVFGGDGSMRVIKVDAKTFIGKNPVHVLVYDREKDKNKVYHLVYRDGKQGACYVKRFRPGGVTRDKVYDLTLGSPSSRVLYFRAFDEDEKSNEDIAVVHVKPALRLRNLTHIVDFGELAIKGRASRGNIVTKHAVAKVIRGSKDDIE